MLRLRWHEVEVLLVVLEETRRVFVSDTLFAGHGGLLHVFLQFRFLVCPHEWLEVVVYIPARVLSGSGNRLLKAFSW